MTKGGFDYSQFRELYENMKKLENGHNKFVEDFLLEMALRLLAKTKRRTPVDVGDLRNKWYLSGVARRGNDVMINIVNSADYASFVEFGHWQQVGRYIPGYWEGHRFIYDPGAVNEEGMVLKNPWVDGVFMCTISLQEIEREMPRRLEAAWKKYAESLLGR
ncbi:MAG: HK97 gp10 family phage protein [Oscillospiraceae bacterium]